MAWWEDFVGAEPEFAGRVRAVFTVRKHCTMATLRRDGSPRISGTEVDFDADGGLYLGSMPGAVKALDLRRDPRVAFHSPTVDPPEANPSDWPGEAKISGRAHEVAAPARDGSAGETPNTADQVTEGDGGDGSAAAAHRFRIEVTEVVLTRVHESNQYLVIESWHPGRGFRSRIRR